MFMVDFLVLGGSASTYGTLGPRVSEREAYVEFIYRTIYLDYP